MRTVEWIDGRVWMIDQRKLPLEFVVVEFDDYRDVARAIQNMTIRGAPAIGAAAAFGLALAAQQQPGRRPRRPAGRPGGRRPDPQRHAAHRRQPLLGDQADDARSAGARADRPGAGSSAALMAEAQRIADEDVAINRRMGAHGAALIQDGFNILTHCNAGSLATVDYGTALAVVRTAHEQGKRIHVWVDETRPRLQGARLTAWELMQAGIPMTLIADNVAGHLLRTGRVDIVLVGSDRMAANGDVANKIGTYKLAVLARENGVPFYPVVPTSTIDLSLSNGDQIPIEERDAREVTHVDGCQIAPDGVRVLNLAFDVTPHRYVTGIVTENGIAYPPFALSLRRMVHEQS